MAEALALVALFAALAAAIARHDRAPEALVALGGAAILIAVGVLSWSDARDEAGDLAPTLVVLAALLVLGDGCERAGLFDAQATRARKENLVLIASDYEQPFGTFTGSLPVAGELRCGWGVMERHEARW